ncbi:MAG TPA: TldD/PmbA family protein [Euryarchaeota archaeon]|nr:TldD/PmbA family protein [Euryarchaeota archaeon]
MEELARYALEKALELGADYVEARSGKGNGEYLLLKNGNAEMVSSSAFRGMSVRLLYQGGMGFSSVNMPDKERTLRAVDEAFSMARAASLVTRNNISFAQTMDHNHVHDRVPKIRFEDIHLADRLGDVMELDRTLEKEEGLVSRVINAGMSQTEKIYINSDGAHIVKRGPAFYMFFTLSVKSGDGNEQAFIQKGELSGWEFFNHSRFEEELGKEIKVLQRLNRGEKPPGGVMDVVIGPEVAGIAVHESVGHPYEADRIMGREMAQAGGSFVKPDMLGKRIGSECVNVVDDPTIPSLLGHYMYDDEGTCARPKYLVKNGIINEFLHNRATADALNGVPNGSARANSYSKEPIVRMSNTYLAPGDSSLSEMISQVKNGVFINNFNEWNIDDRRYNQKYVGREAYLIKNGEIRSPLKRPVLELTTPQLYSSVSLVGGKDEVVMVPGLCGKGDLYQIIPVTMGGAPALLKNIRLGVVS